MTAPRLHYVYDPLCGWCYAAAPMVRAVEDAGIGIVMHGGGLWDSATEVGREKSTYIRQNDDRIAALTGLPFGPAYMNGLLNDPGTVLWSQPTIAAVLAAGEIKPGADLTTLRAIQDAHYVSGRRVVDRAILIELVSAIGLAEDAFLRAFNSDAASEHIQRTRQWMRQLGLRGFPSFVLERRGELIRVQHEPFYGRPEAFVSALGEMTAPSFAA